VYEGALTVGGGVCAAIFERGLCLPTGSALSETDQERVVETIESVPG
jgi:pyridoxal phosphate-dependent aminotransferase EpsN